MRHVLLKAFIFALIAAIPTITRAAGAPPAAAPAPTAEERQQQEIQRAERHLNELQSVRARITSQLIETRQQIRDQTGLVEVTPVSIRQVIGKLQEQREQLELDGAGAAGRRKGIDEAVAELSVKLKDRATSDPVADELAKVVEVRQAQLKRMEELNRQAVVSQESLDSAHAALATARAELAAARQKAVNTSSTDVLDAWNRQRLELSINELERQARLEFVSKRLAAYSKALSSLDQLEELRSQLIQAERAVAKAQDDLELVRRRIEMGIIYGSPEEKLKESTKRP